MDEVKQFARDISHRLSHGKTEPDFFEIVRRFEQLKWEQPRMGYGKNPDEDILRFGQEPYLCFPENSLASIQERGRKATVLLIVYFLGLCGVNGPMPLEFTSIVFQRSHNHYDLTLQRFLDIINHRFIVLFYRAWAENEVTVSFDRIHDDSIGTMLRGLIGCTPNFAESLWPEAEYSRMAAAAYCGAGGHSRTGLEQLLSEYLHSEVAVEDMVMATYPIPLQFQCKLGREDTSCLGVNMQLGHNFISMTKKIEVRFGPMNFADYLQLLPGCPGFQHLCALIAMYIDKSFFFDFVFGLRTETLPQAKLDGSVALGRSLWLGKVRQTNTEIRIESSRIFDGMHKTSRKHVAADVGKITKNHHRKAGLSWEN